MRILQVVDSHAILHEYPLPEQRRHIVRILEAIKYGEVYENDMRDYDIQLKTIFAGDLKPYWRSFQDPNYKANRPKRSLAYPKLLQIKGYEDSLYIENFECDDIAGLIWRMWPKLRYEYDFLVYFTIDSDWLQLCNIEDVAIIDIKGYLPAYRSYATAWIWVKQRLRSKYVTKKAKAELETILETCDQTLPSYWADVIRMFKFRVGDKIDNIPAMAPEYMTNLLVPPHGDFGLELDSYIPHINNLLTKQNFVPAKLCQQYVEDCVIEDFTRIPLVDRRNWEEMKLKKFERPDLLAFMR